jgi:hypothetical protein
MSARTLLSTAAAAVVYCWRQYKPSEVHILAAAPLSGVLFTCVRITADASADSVANLV